MTLAEILRAVDELSSEDLRLLREHIEEREELSQQQKLARLRQAKSELRASLTSQELDEIEWAMNVEFPDSDTRLD